MQVANVNLPIKVTGRHVSVTEAIKDYAIKKVENLHLDFPRIIEVHVILDVQKYRHLAEVVLHCANHITMDARSESGDMYASIDQVMDKVAQQMRKFKTKIMRQHRPRHGVVREFHDHLLSEEGFEEALPELEPSVVETERYLVKPMFLDEALLQLKISEDRQFLVFQNVKTNKTNVIYRRKDGAIGLIEPTFE